MFVPRPCITHESIGKRLAITLWWLAVACAALVFCPVVARADTLTAECRVFQRYMIDTSGLPVEFDYQLVAVSENAPMPEGAQGSTYTWTFRRDDERILQIPVDTDSMAEGTTMYTYTMSPVTTELTEGLYYDTSNDRALTYTMEVYTFSESVYGAPKVQAIIRKPDGTKPTDPGWYVCWNEQTSPASKRPSSSGGSGGTPGGSSTNSNGSSTPTASRTPTSTATRIPTASTGDASSSAYVTLGAAGAFVIVLSAIFRRATSTKEDDDRT